MSDLLCVTCPVLRGRHRDGDCRCGGCRPRRPDRPPVCEGCRAHLERMLTEIPDVLLGIPYARIWGASEIKSKAYESKPPIDVEALGDLAGIGLGSPLGVLDGWARDWAETRRERLPLPTLYSVTTWLTVRLEWACDQHPAVDEFAQDVRQLRQRLRRWEERQDGSPVGPCPRRPDDQRCGGRLVADPYERTITCPRCGAVWDRETGGWVQLVAQQAAAA